MTADGRADALWDDREVLPHVPASPELHLDGFDGPLDLLLDLAERARIDLACISVTTLIDQCVAALARYEGTVPIERRADWLVLAARLLVLRARLLFASNPEAAQAAEREAARELARLRDLRRIKAASAWLEARPQIGRDVFTRARQGRDPRLASYVRLMEACLTVLEGRAGQPTLDAPVYRPAIADLFRVQEVIDRMRRRVEEAEEAQPLAAFLPTLPARARDRPLIARSALAATFGAGLELARAAQAHLTQDGAFTTISVRRGAASPPPSRH